MQTRKGGNEWMAVLWGKRRRDKEQKDENKMMK